MANRKNPFMKFISDFDKEAEAFLTKYECTEALTKPMPIPIWDIAKKMSLQVIQTECLSNDDSVQGAIAFDKGVIDVYDWNSQEYVGYEVDGGMVFIDACVVNTGRINNTLAHECFHWYKHRNYFTYNRTHNLGNSGFAFRCEKGKASDADGTSTFSDEETMEWQARTIAPKILMPKKAALLLLQQLEKKAEGFVNRAEATELMIIEFAETFNVSKQSAAIRMGELGCTNALEFFQYETDLQISQRRNRYGSAAKRYQQPISFEKAFQLYYSNDFLKTVLNTGAFCYTVDGYFSLREQKYVTESNEKYVLTEYAKQHLSECTIDFVKKLTIDHTRIQFAASGTMFRAGIPYEEQDSFESTAQNTELYNKAADFEKRFCRTKSLHQTANERLWQYMQDEHWNSSIFQSKTKLDAMNYTRVQKPDHKFKIEQLVAMGVGLALTAQEMQEVLQLSGSCFCPTDHSQQAYAFLFSAYSGKNIDECNAFLKTVDVPPLGSQQRL